MKKIFLAILTIFALSVSCSKKCDLFVGEYRTDDSLEDPDAYYQTLVISLLEDNTYQVTFTATEIQGEAGCSFEGEGKLVDGNIEVPITEWTTPATMVIKSTENQNIEVSTKDEENRYALNYFCKGGGSLAGDYKKVTK